MLLDLTEHFEDLGQHVPRNANSVVSDGDHDMIALHAGHDPDRSVRGRELGGVVQDVSENLRQACRIAIDKYGLVGQ